MASKRAAPSMQRMSVPKGGLGLGGLFPKEKSTPEVSPVVLNRSPSSSASRISNGDGLRVTKRRRTALALPELNFRDALATNGTLRVSTALGRPLPPHLVSRIFLHTLVSNGSPLPAIGSKFLYQMNVLDRADLLTKIPAEACDTLYEEMGVTKEYLLSTLKMSAATLGRKARSAAPLSSDEAEKILGVICLIGQVESMVEESGNANGFDAAKWFAEWIKSPNAALGGRRADELLSFGDGRQLLSGLLSQMQAGTYA